MKRKPAPSELPELAISPESVCWVIVKSREFDAKDEVTEPDPGSNPSDDHMISVLEDHGDDPAGEEVTTFINGMTVDEQIDLVALAWLGRGDGDIAGWADLRNEAASAHNNRTGEYLLGMPLLSDYLEEALGLFGHSCEEFEANHL